MKFDFIMTCYFNAINNFWLSKHSKSLDVTLNASSKRTKVGAAPLPTKPAVGQFDE